MGDEAHVKAVPPGKLAPIGPAAGLLQLVGAREREEPQASTIRLAIVQPRDVAKRPPTRNPVLAAVKVPVFRREGAVGELLREDRCDVVLHLNGQEVAPISAIPVGLDLRPDAWIVQELEILPEAYLAPGDEEVGELDDALLFGIESQRIPAEDRR